MKQSAGLLLFRNNAGIEFFLVHPGGPYFGNKKEGWWTIPKGEIQQDEDLLSCAVREFKEETGFVVQGDFISLGQVTQKAGKVVHCWALEQDIEAEKIASNHFELEWPPRSGKIRMFPEIDRAGWFGIEEARLLINERQIPFLNEVLKLI